MHVYFREDQRFRQPFLWIPLIFGSAFLSGTTFWMIYRQVGQGLPFNEAVLNDARLVALGGCVVAVNLILVLYYVVAKLQVEVNERGLYLRFFPYHFKTRHLSLDNVATISANTYRPFMEYGGYGVRRYPRATSYAVTGDQGVRIDYENGCHILIGTQHPDALFQALQRVLDQPEG